MANQLTTLNLCNQALRMVGDSPVTTLATTTVPRVNAFNEHYATKRDALLESHNWRFATVRTTLYAYTAPAGTLTPAATTGSGILFTSSVTSVFGLDAVGQRLVGVGVPGDATIVALVATSPAATLTPGTGALTPGTTGVIFTASAGVLAAGNVGKLIENLNGNGVARITAFTDVTHVVATIEEAWDALTAMASAAWRLVATDQVTADITSDFAAVTPIASGNWRLYNAAPGWGFSFRINLPADYLINQRMRISQVFQEEDGFIATDAENIELTYTRRVTDVTRWPAYFVEAMVASMVTLMAEPMTGQRAKTVDWYEMAARKLARAKLLDSMRGSPPMLRASDLANARVGGMPRYTTDE